MKPDENTWHFSRSKYANGRCTICTINIFYRLPYDWLDIISIVILGRNLDCFLLWLMPTQLTIILLPHSQGLLAKAASFSNYILKKNIHIYNNYILLWKTILYSYVLQDSTSAPQLADKWFTREEVPLEEQDPLFRSSDIHLLQLRKKPTN